MSEPSVEGWAQTEQGRSRDGIAEMADGMEGNAVRRIRALSCRAARAARLGSREDRADRTRLSRPGGGFRVVERTASAFRKRSSSASRESSCSTLAPDESRGCFRQAIDDCPSSERQVLGAPGHDEPQSAAAEARQERRSTPDARRDLRLVHRGVRHGRLEGREGAARRAVNLTDEACCETGVIHGHETCRHRN